MQDIGKQGQDVLGRNIGDSGTTIRSAALNLASGGGIGGAAYAGGPAVAVPTAAYLGALQTPQTTRALLELLNATSIGTGAAVPMASAYGTQGLLK